MHIIMSNYTYEVTIHVYSHAVIYIRTYVRTNILPYEWYIWRTLSLAIWEEKQIGGYLVCRMSLFIIRID